MKIRKTCATIAIAILFSISFPSIHQTAAAVAEEIETHIVANQYDLKITEPTLEENVDGSGIFYAKADFDKNAAGKTIRIVIAFYDNDSKMISCWAGSHVLAPDRRIELTGELPKYSSVGVYFFEDDSLAPIRPRILRLLDDQVQAEDADLAALKAELVSIDQRVTHLSEQFATDITESTELVARKYDIVPGNVDTVKMDLLLNLASEQNKTIRFEDGEYIFSDTICVGSNTSIVGSTNTVFKLSADSTANALMSVGAGADNVYLSHLILQGEQSDMPSKKGNKIGLTVSGAVRINIENVEIAGFDLYGFYASQMSSTPLGDFYKMLQITNCRFYNNYYGMCLGPRCEYTQVLNCVFGNNQVGCLNQGGNNSYVSCIFNVNGTGFQMDSKGLSNPAHGGCNGCAFNHNSKPIVVNDCTIGWIFNGCQIFYGDVELNQSSGVVFNSCIFGSCVVNSSHTTLKNANLISDSFFQTDSAEILSGNDGSVYVTNCLPDHLPQTPPEQTPENGKSIRLVHSTITQRNKAASVDAYFAPLTHQVPSDTEIGYLDIVIHGATNEGQSIKNVDVWVGNAHTGEIMEHLVVGTDMSTVYSDDLNGYVVRVEIGTVYPYPAFFVMEAERTAGRGISYDHSKEKINFFAGKIPQVGDILTPNHTYVPEFAVYEPEITS